MRVLMTADTVGGVWTYAVELARALRPHGVRFALLTAGRALSPAQRAQVDALPNVHLFESEDRLEWMSDPWDDVRRTGDRLECVARQWQPDVVHLNGYSYGQRDFGVPTLTVGHSCVRSWFRAVKGCDAPAEWDRYTDEVTRGLRSVDATVAPSRAMLDALEMHYGPVTSPCVVHNGRDAGVLGPGEKADVVFASGRVWDDAKNIATLAAAANGLPWPVRVAGDGAGPDGQAAATEAVQRLGHLDERAMAGELSRAAIYTLPARYEPFGLSILEAALSGCALVLGDIDSLRELWSGAAVFVPPEDARALHEAIARLIAAPAERAAFGRQAMARAARYGTAAMARAYLDLYERLTAAVAVEER